MAKKDNELEFTPGTGNSEKLKALQSRLNFSNFSFKFFCM